MVIRHKKQKVLNMWRSMVWKISAKLFMAICLATNGQCLHSNWFFKGPHHTTYHHWMLVKLHVFILTSISPLPTIVNLPWKLASSLWIPFYHGLGLTLNPRPYRASQIELLHFQQIKKWFGWFIVRMSTLTKIFKIGWNIFIQNSHYLHPS